MTKSIAPILKQTLLFQNQFFIGKIHKERNNLYVKMWIHSTE